jgi:hypothetical protein
MKKVVTVLMLMVLLCALLAVPANAARDPMAEKLDETLRRLDHFYDYNEWYMISEINRIFVSYDSEENYATVPAAEYEAQLHKYFVIDDAMLQRIRTCDPEILAYDADAKTYRVCRIGGFGGTLAEREYLGYVKKGNTYEVYYRHLTYEYLDDVLPEGTTVEDLMGTEWVDTVEYGGNTYQGGPDGYYRIKSRDNFGRKYTVELNGDVVRIISCVEYTAGQQPGAFDDKEVPDVTYDIPENGTVSIPENECFEANTTVKVEQITAGDTHQAVSQAMATVAQQYVAYDFTATRDNVAVQPSGKLLVTFAIPEGYSDQISVYYMAPDGKLEKLATTVDTNTRTVSVELEHFSTYILADEATKPHQHEYSKLTLAPTCTDEGYTVYTCACGDTYTDDRLDPLGHRYEDWEQVPDTDQETRTCDRCGDVESRTAVTDGETSDNTWIIIVVVAAVVIAAGVVTFIVIRKKK